MTTVNEKVRRRRTPRSQGSQCAVSAGASAAEEVLNDDDGARPVSADARIVRSRDGLREALLTLLETTAFDRISIRDITATAEVGYRTFFRHYPSKEALLADIATDACAELVELTLPVYEASASRSACLALCSFVHGKRPLWTALLTGGAASVVRDELLQRSRAITAARPVAAGWLPADLSSTLAVSTIIEILTWWLRQRRPLPAAQVAEIMDRMAIAPAERKRSR